MDQRVQRDQISQVYFQIGGREVPFSGPRRVDTKKGNVPLIGFKTRHDSTGSRVWDLHEFNPYPSSEFAREVYGHAP